MLYGTPTWNTYQAYFCAPTSHYSNYDTFVIQKAEHSQQFRHHINTQDHTIQFTVKEPDQHGSLPFLDTKVTPGPSNILSTTVYRKPIHTDEYLHWNSNHFIRAKHSVYNTLAHRAKVVSSDQQSLHQELEHISMALSFSKMGTQQVTAKYPTQTTQPQWNQFNRPTKSQHHQQQWN